MSQIEENIDTCILELEAQTGLREGFFTGLLAEDDWSFIIKLHALIEAACTHHLHDYFQDQNVSEVFSTLDLSDNKCSKITFLEKLELIGSDSGSFISSLSDLRSSLVHDIKDHEFSLRELIESLDNQQINHFATVFSPKDTLTRKMKDIIDPLPEVLERSRLENVIIRVKNDPKYFIWFGAYSTLVTITDVYNF